MFAKTWQIKKKNKNMNVCMQNCYKPINSSESQKEKKIFNKNLRKFSKTKIILNFKNFL